MSRKEKKKVAELVAEMVKEAKEVVRLYEQTPTEELITVKSGIFEEEGVSKKAELPTSLEHHASMAAIEWFIESVNERAESKMLKTGKLEGAHFASMRQIWSELNQDD